MARDFLYGSNFLPLSYSRRWLDITRTHRLRSVLLHWLECRRNSCFDASRDLFCGAFDSLVYISGQPDCPFGPSVHYARKDKGCMSRIRILPEAVANKIAAGAAVLGGAL